MIRPDAIPLLASASRAILPPATVEALFGRGYRWRGTERVRLGGGPTIPARRGDEPALLLDRLDATGLDGSLRLVGPRGSIEAPRPRPVPRELVLPAALRRAWGLEVRQQVAVEVGAIIVTGVGVVDGDPAGVRLDRVDLLAAGTGEDATARLRRDVAAPAGSAEEESPPLARLITENDVRQARLHGRRIVVRPGQILTPAARSLGRELGVLEWPDG